MIGGNEFTIEFEWLEESYVQQIGIEYYLAKKTAGYCFLTVKTGEQVPTVWFGKVFQFWG